MSPRRPAPVHVLCLAALVAVAVAATMIILATGQRWMGLRLQFDPAAGGAVVRQAMGPAATIPIGTVFTAIQAGGDRVDFTADDFLYEPDGTLQTFATYETFLARQGRISAMTTADTVTLLDDQGGQWTLEPRDGRAAYSLPPDFWVQVFVGVFAWLIAAGIWAFRRDDVSARYLLLSGAATLVFAPFAAVYSTRELALPATLFRWLNDLNFLGGSLFAAALAGLMLYYPRRLAPRWVGLAIVALFLAWFVAQQLGLFDSMTLARRLLVLIAVLSTFALAGVHWRLTRIDPVARAALQWFLLSWLVCASVFAGVIFVPQIFGVDTSGLQGYGFSLFLLLYVGLAFGVLRFRLFELGDWWIRVMVWVASLALLAGLDLLFVLGLHLSTGASLGLALLITGIAWLPLRALIWDALSDEGAVSERTLFRCVADIGLVRDPQDQAERWTALLRRQFDPLQLEPRAAVDSASLEEDGVVLNVPGAGETPGLRLAFAKGGRRLFTPRDVALADEMAGMLKHVVEARGAYDTGVVAERRRIARDIHDNLGAQLLNALHSRAGERKDRLIREAMSDLRAIINDDADPRSLVDALSDLRHAAAERLAARQIELDWPIDEGGGAQPPADLVHALRSIIREALSNVIKHARASRVRVLVRGQDGRVGLEIEDDGVGFDGLAPSTGAGIANMQSRATGLGGSIGWSRGDSGGARLRAELPFTAAAE
jgi:two-component system sensor histidine kinase DevS